MINKAIFHILSNDDPVKELVSTRIFAVVCPEKTPFPLIVYSSSVGDVEYSKSGHEADASTVSILILSKDYSDGVDILAAVRTALEWKKGTFNGVSIGDARVKGIDEGYDLEADAFYQTISMKFINK